MFIDGPTHSMTMLMTQCVCWLQVRQCDGVFGLHTSCRISNEQSPLPAPCPHHHFTRQNSQERVQGVSSGTDPRGTQEVRKQL